MSLGWSGSINKALLHSIVASIRTSSEFSSYYDVLQVKARILLGYAYAAQNVLGLSEVGDSGRLPSFASFLRISI